MPGLRQLSAFVAVAEELNFTRAAERLSVGQQAVSKSIRQLELELDVELVERTTREVRLTAAGEALLALGRPALASVQAAFASARDIGHGLTGVVRIGCSPAVGPVERQRVIEALRDGAPEASVMIRDIRPDEASQGLAAHELDFVVARTVERTPELEIVALRPTDAILCVPGGHRLAAAGTASLADLDGERLLVWTRPGTAFTDLMLSRVAVAGATIEALVSRVQGGGTSLVELAERDAVALMPLGWHEEEDVVQVALTDDVTLPLVMAWRVGSVPAAVRRVRAKMGRG